MAAPLADLASAPSDYSAPAIGVGCDGALYSAARDSAEPLVDVQAGVLFPKSRLEKPVDYLLTAWQGGDTRSTLVEAESILVSFVQPHPEGMLLAGARCSWKQSRAERNALVVDFQGNVLRRFSLGDGIEDVRVTPDGTIWVSYFDEGVFGNRGWNDPGPAPIGAAGLVAFAPDGKLKRAYNAAEAGTDDICDAYALNVVGNDDVWVYFYADFPVVHVARHRYRVWNPDVSGAHAIAVHDRRLLVVGEYDSPDIVRVLELDDDGTTRVQETLWLTGDEGESLAGSKCTGVGKELYVFKGSSVLVVRDW